MAFNTDRFASASAGVCAHAGVDLGGLVDAALVAMQRDLGEARRALDSLAAEVAGAIQSRADAAPGPGGIARRVGFKNTGELIAETLGTSMGEARRLTNVGRVLQTADAVVASGDEAPAERGWPLVAAAVRANTITVEKAEIVTAALTALGADEALERKFLEFAECHRARDLRRVCDREVELRDAAGAEERDKRRYRARNLTLSLRRDGMTEVTGLLDPMSAAHFKAWLDAQVRAGFQAQRVTPGDLRTPGQMRVDALAMLAHHAMTCDAPGSGVATTLVARVDFETLKSGVGFGTCDSLEAPIAVGTLRAMAVDAGILPVVMGGASLPLDVGRTRRGATQAQRIALAERDGGCAWCHAPTSYCDVHHITHWLFGGKTNMDNLVMLCVSCHHRIHYDQWRIEVKQGEVWFTPPEDIDPTRTPRKGGLANLELAA